MRIAVWSVAGLIACLYAQADLEALWAERDNPEKAEKAIALLEAQGKNGSLSVEATVKLARLYYLLGEQTEDKSKRLERYDRTFQLCKEALVKQLGLPATAKDEEIVKKAGTEHLPLLYWAAAGIARYGKHAPFSQKLKARPVIRLYWDRVYELQPDYFYGGGYRFFGGYYALVPAITGEQDVNKAKEMLDKAVQAAPEYLETKVIYAEAYAAHPKVKDKELFRRLLREVAQADPNTNPEIAAENRLAQQKAKKLLAQEGEVFEE